MGSSSTDEIKMHAHHKEQGDFMNSPRKELNSNSDDEQISNDEEDNVPSKFSVVFGATKFRKDHIYNRESENCEGASSWSAVLKEAEELVCLQENAGSFSSHAAYSEGKKIGKVGSRGKSKPKFSIRLQSHKEEHSWPSMVKNENDNSSKFPQMPEGLEALEHEIMEHSMTELLEGLQEEKGKQSEGLHLPTEIVTIGDRDKKHSMAELLDDVLEKNDSLKGASKTNSKKKGRRLHLTSKRNISSLGDRSLDNEDPPEPMDSGSSSEDEATDQNPMKLAIPEIKGQTMADRFQEALIAATGNDGRTLFAMYKQTGSGYYGMLQQVIQNEKERHMEFLKHLQGGACPHDDMRCIYVKILSRYLDAKLTVCHCSFNKTIKSSQCAESLSKIMDNDGGRKRTIIFSTRICNNVELEVGNWICIYPPWKEVQIIGHDEAIILCTFFSQISP